MKIILMNGGLGNQLFQYVFYRYIEFATGDICYIDDSAFWGNNIEHNGFEIEKIFDLKCNLLSSFFDDDVWNEMLTKKKEGISIPQQLHNVGIDISVIAETDDLEFNGNVLNVNNDNDLLINSNIYYHGYWITNKWFNLLKEEMLNDLQFPSIKDAENKMILKYILSTNSVSLHVRRGDFVSLGRALNENYYVEAIKTIESKITNATYFIFSDDIIWCKEHKRELSLDKIEDKLIFVNVNYGNKAYIDMQLMLNCKHMILANSSFSAFAANLNKNKDKIVILPGK